MSPIRHILMHVDSSEQSLHRLAYCRGLAERLGAKVTALYAVTPWLLMYPLATDLDGSVAIQLSQWDRERLKTTHERFLTALADDRTCRWAQLDSDSPFEFAKEALYADLMVLGRRSKEDPARNDVPGDFNTHAILHSGKPAVILPPGATPCRFPEVVLVAWSARPESAAALSAALPFLQAAKEVHVVHGSSLTHDDSGLDALSNHLLMHGVEARVKFLTTTAHDVGRLLLDQARDVRADLLVMGCYGHSRTREWVLGGATQTVLADAMIPVLMMH